MDDGQIDCFAIDQTLDHLTIKAWIPGL